MKRVKSTTKTFIDIPFSFYREHYYPRAPESVQFLRERHPHDFTCEVSLEVKNDARELEFYIVRSYLNKTISQFPAFLEDTSCEMLASMLLKDLQLVYGCNRDITVSVKEDNTYGARKVYTH